MVFWSKGASGFSASSTAEQVTQGIDGSGLIAIVTGSTSGIGTETARVLALRGVHVIMAVRNTAAGRDVKDAILKEIPAAKIDVMELDVSSLASVRKFASDFNSRGLPLNILINNAGIMAIPFKLSKDNVEMQFATNHLGHFHLCNLLLDNMKKTARQSGREGRIVIVGSEVYKMAYSEGIRFDRINDESGYGTGAYGQSKLANILHANELARRLKDEGAQVTVNSLHPGVIATNIFRSATTMGAILSFFGKFFMKNIQQGAATTCYIALNPQVEGKSGLYFCDCNVAQLNATALDTESQKKLWDLSVDLINKSSRT